MKDYALTRTVAPVERLISRHVAADHVRVGIGEDDLRLDAASSTAEYAAQEQTGRSLLTQTWQLKLPRPDGPIRLPMPPLQSVTSVTYFDQDDAEQTMPAEDYRVLGGRDWAEIEPVKNWPISKDRRDAFTVTYMAGFGDEPHTVPKAIIQAVLLLTAHFYDHRDAVGSRDAMPIPYGVEYLLAQERVGWISA